MNETEIEKTISEIELKLLSLNEIVLATSHNDIVTARTIYSIYDDGSVYFITSSAYTKCKQIQKNKNVALAIDDIQMKGSAEILGHPLNEENSFFLKIIERDKRFEEYFNRFSRYKRTVLIKVDINFVSVYKKR